MRIFCGLELEVEVEVVEEVRGETEIEVEVDLKLGSVQGSLSIRECNWEPSIVVIVVELGVCFDVGVDLEVEVEIDVDVDVDGDADADIFELDGHVEVEVEVKVDAVFKGGVEEVDVRFVIFFKSVSFVRLSSVCSIFSLFTPDLEIDEWGFNTRCFGVNNISGICTRSALMWGYGWSSRRSGIKHEKWKMGNENEKW